MNYRDITASSYNKIIESYNSENDKDAKSIYDDKIIKKLLKFVNWKNLKGRKLLELGFGTGRDIVLFKKQGLEDSNYTGVDLSERMTQLSTSKYPKLSFLTRDLLSYEYPENKYDMFWACAVLLHLNIEDTNIVLKKLHMSLKSDAIGFISLRVKQGRDDREAGMVEANKDGKSISRYFSFYKPDDFKKILLNNGFDVLNTERRFEPDGKTEFVFYYVKKT